MRILGSSLEITMKLVRNNTANEDVGYKTLATAPYLRGEIPLVTRNYSETQKIVNTRTIHGVILRFKEEAYHML